MSTTLHPPRSKVKNNLTNCTKNQHFTGTSLVPLLLKRKGEMDQFFYAPACCRCGKAILDLNTANVSVSGWDFSKTKLETLADGTQVFALNCDGAGVFCKACDRDDRKPRTSADCCFQRDQRRA